MLPCNGRTEHLFLYCISFCSNITALIFVPLSLILQMPTRKPTPRPSPFPTLSPTPFPTTAEPTGPHILGVTCSTAGQRSQECGASAIGNGGNERPKACCPGWKCDPRYPGRCVVDPGWVPPTLKPTKKVCECISQRYFFG